MKKERRKKMESREKKRQIVKREIVREFLKNKTRPNFFIRVFYQKWEHTL